MKPRKGRDPIRQLTTKPSSFLKRNTLNARWTEDPRSANNRSQSSTLFYLVRQENDRPAHRPGAVLGRLHPHTIKNYLLMRDKAAAEASGEIAGSFHAPRLAVRQVTSDTSPDPTALQQGALDLRHLHPGAAIFTIDLTGCTIKRDRHLLHHLQPAADGVALYRSLGNRNTFGPQDYGQYHPLVMFRMKRGGLKAYAQSVDPAPSSTVHRLPQGPLLKKTYL